MDTCIFCKIIKKEIPTEIIYEDDAVFAFLDAQPRSPGHTLVIPKNHTENLLDMQKEAVGPFFERVQAVLNMVKRALDPDGFTLGINHGKWAGQAVDHLHFHIMPRWKDDGGHSIHWVVTNIPDEEPRIIAERIRGK
ncbi:MAG: HIT family protein [Patescibacteria group bacterium]